MNLAAKRVAVGLILLAPAQTVTLAHATAPSRPLAAPLAASRPTSAVTIPPTDERREIAAIRASRSEARRALVARTKQNFRKVDHGPRAAPRSTSRSDAETIGWPWDALVRCEAPDRGWRYGAPDVGIDSGYYFEGGPNFTHETWVAYGGGEYAEHAWDATPVQQIIVAKRVLAAQGWGAWPVCSRKLGLR